MNKNDKFQVEEFEVSAQAISDEKLEGVSGGNGHSALYTCPYCGMSISKVEFYSSYHHGIGICVSDVQNFFKPYTPSQGTYSGAPDYNGLYTQNS